MKLIKKSLPILLTTGAVLAAAPMKSNADPFDYQIFRSESYLIADLDEEGCGGAMTEYRRAPSENGAVEKNESVPNTNEAESDEVEKDVGIIEKIKSFWSNLFVQTDK